jgi:hypothetical protein
MEVCVVYKRIAIDIKAHTCWNKGWKRHSIQMVTKERRGDCCVCVNTLSKKLL